MAQQDLKVVRAATQWHILNNPSSPFATKLQNTFDINLASDLDNIPLGEELYMKQVIFAEFDDGTFFGVQAFKGGYRSYASHALIQFLDDGGQIDGFDDVIIPTGRTIREM